MKRIICLALTLILLLNPLLVKAMGAHACTMQNESVMSMQMSMSHHDSDMQGDAASSNAHDCCDETLNNSSANNNSCSDCNDCAAKCHTSCCLFEAQTPMVDAGIAYAEKAILLIPYPEPYASTVIPPIA